MKLLVPGEKQDTLHPPTHLARITMMPDEWMEGIVRPLGDIQANWVPFLIGIVIIARQALLVGRCFNRGGERRARAYFFGRRYL